MPQGFFISSVPKAGTHLLSTLIEQHSGVVSVSVKEKQDLESVDFSRYAASPNLVGHYRLEHLRASASLTALLRARSVLVLLRDPRDLCNSMLHYLLKSPKRVHQEAAKLIRHLEYDQQIRQIADGFITEDGSFVVPDVRAWCDGFLQIREVAPVQVFRYEDFFDEELIVPGVVRALGVDPGRALELVRAALGGTSKTKREGGAVPYQWRRYFSPALRDFFEDRYGDVFKSLGYAL